MGVVETNAESCYDTSATTMKKLLLMIAVLVGVGLFATPKAQAGIFIGLPLPVPVFFGGPSYYGGYPLRILRRMRLSGMATVAAITALRLLRWSRLLWRPGLLRWSRLLWWPGLQRPGLCLARLCSPIAAGTMAHAGNQLSKIIRGNTGIGLKGRFSQGSRLFRANAQPSLTCSLTVGRLRRTVTVLPL